MRGSHSIMLIYIFFGFVPLFSPLLYSSPPSLPLLPSLVCCYCTYFLLMKCPFPPDFLYVSFKKAKFLWKDLWNLHHVVPVPSVLLEKVYFFLPQVREVNFVSDAIMVKALKKRNIGAIASGWLYIMLLVPLSHKPPHCGHTVHKSPSHHRGLFLGVYLRACVPVCALSCVFATP